MRTTHRARRRAQHRAQQHRPQQPCVQPRRITLRTKTPLTGSFGLKYFSSAAWLFRSIENATWHCAARYASTATEFSAASNDAPCRCAALKPVASRCAANLPAARGCALSRASTAPCRNISRRYVAALPRYLARRCRVTWRGARASTARPADRSPAWQIGRRRMNARRCTARSRPTAAPSQPRRPLSGETAQAVAIG